MRSKRQGVFIASAVGIALVVLPALPASAASRSFQFDSSVNSDGSLTQYDTYRDQVSGPAKYTYRSTDFGDHEFRVGLRKKPSDDQFTKSLSFTSTGVTKSFTRADNGSSTIPTGSYAMNARVVGSINPLFNRYSATLILNG